MKKSSYENHLGKWLDKTRKLNNSNSREIFIRSRQIWFCNLGINIGSEQNGSIKNLTRPVLILKNIDKNLVFIIPITSTNSQSSSTEIKANKINGFALLNQARIIDKRRLIFKVDTLDSSAFFTIKKNLQNFLFENIPLQKIRSDRSHSVNCKE